MLMSQLIVVISSVVAFVIELLKLEGEQFPGTGYDNFKLFQDRKFHVGSEGASRVVGRRQRRRRLLPSRTRRPGANVIKRSYS
jgi:hypothetical protein